MAGAPEARVVHRIPGRMRLRIPERQRDSGYFAKAAAALGGYTGVAAVEANAATASLLIVHDDDEDAILAFARSRDLFVVADPGLRPPVALASERWLAVLGELNQRFSNASDGRGDIGSLLATTFILIAAVQFSRGRIAMPAISALWYALRALSLTRQWPAAPEQR